MCVLLFANYFAHRWIQKIGQSQESAFSLKARETIALPSIFNTSPLGQVSSNCRMTLIILPLTMFLQTNEPTSSLSSGPFSPMSVLLQCSTMEPALISPPTLWPRPGLRWRILGWGKCSSSGLAFPMWLVWGSGGQNGTGLPMWHVNQAPFRL